MKLQKKQYILECWNCKSKIIYSHSDCNYDGRYHSYELKCPNCQQRYSTERRELFHREYKTEDNITIDQLTNNWNELEDILKIKKARMLNEPDYSKYYLGGYETAIQTTHSSHSGIMLETAKKSIVVLCDELLDKMKEIKEKNNGN